MTKAERAKVQEYVDELCRVLGLKSIRISPRYADKMFKDPTVMAAFGLDHRSRRTIYISSTWMQEPAWRKRQTLAHELLHGELLPISQQAEGWMKRGHISPRQFAEFIEREERVVYALERHIAAILPEWED